MKRWGRLIFVFIAYSLAMLHTAVPHHHGVSRNGGTTVSNARCSAVGDSGGLLQRALSTDLGYGHLENFKKSSNTELEFSTDASPAIEPLQSVLVATPIVFVTSFFDGYIANFKRRLLLFGSTQFRAPPQLF